MSFGQKKGYLKLFPRVDFLCRIAAVDGDSRPGSYQEDDDDADLVHFAKFFQALRVSCRFDDLNDLSG